MVSEITMTSVDLLFLFFVLRIISARNFIENTCADRSTVCTNIHNCPSLSETLKNSKLQPHEILRVLINLQCGFKGNYLMVCCINQSTVITKPIMTTKMTETVVQLNADIPDYPDVINHPNLHILNHKRWH